MTEKRGQKGQASTEFTVMVFLFSILGLFMLYKFVGGPTGRGGSVGRMDQRAQQQIIDDGEK